MPTMKTTPFTTSDNSGEPFNDRIPLMRSPFRASVTSTDASDGRLARFGLIDRSRSVRLTQIRRFISRV
jgi:hypothetical protein